MPEKDKLIEQLLRDERLQRISSKVYTDEPLLISGAALKSRSDPSPGRTSAPPIPEQILRMREIPYSKEALWKSSAWVFRKQGQFMAEYTDNAPYNEAFVKYYVTYSGLTTEQLRGFFTFRTQLRKTGNIPPDTPIPFLFLYAYELINGIGVSSAQEGYRLLRELWVHCSGNHRIVVKYLSRWLGDYVICNGLDTALLRELPEFTREEKILTLIHCRERSDEQVWDALSELTAFPWERSRLVLAYPQEFRLAAVRVFRGMDEYQEKHGRLPLWTKLFGRLSETVHIPFQDAVYWSEDDDKNADISVNEIHSYTCRQGTWRCTKIYSSSQKSEELGGVMKAIDCLMRERTGLTYPLKMPDIPKSRIKLITAVLDRMDEEKRRREASHINIDLSALGTIRAEAAEIRDKLLVEEYEDEPEPIVPESAPEPADTGLLTPGESAFVAALLSGGDWAAAAREQGSMPSVIADSVNEKLFDTFGDTVIEFSGDTPAVIGDYADELRDMIS